MGRIVALDYGTKRTGIAVTDPLQIIATPLDTVATHELIEYLSVYLKKESVDIIVIGKPSKKDGTDSKIEPLIVGLIRKIKRLFPYLKIERYDERFSSKRAEDIIRKTVKKKKDREDKSLIDQVSACIILQDYMGIYEE